MGPRFLGRGNGQFPVEKMEKVIASMGPRFLGRGNDYAYPHKAKFTTTLQWGRAF